MPTRTCGHSAGRTPRPVLPHAVDSARKPRNRWLAKAALEKANNPDQAAFFPYLTGYVAFYGGDYKTAITELGKANQEDPFILMLLGESYEKVGDAAHAKEYYSKVMSNNGHGPTNAFARPVARRKLAGG